MFSTVLGFASMSLYLVTSHKLFYDFYHLWTIHHLGNENKIILYSSDCIKKWNIVFKLLIIFPCLIYSENSIEIVFKLLIPFLFIIHYLISFPDKNDVLETNNLNIGYGAALWYYKNYLTLFLPHDFIERIENFKSSNKVDVQKKHFILVPESCRVQRYLDTNEPDYIERCQELPKLEKTHSGIKDRTYNITVYLIKADPYAKGIRIAVEYAQPLKGLFAFKEKKLLTETEMFHQRKLFVQFLQEFLRDQYDSYKFCDIIEYNDEEKKISEVLLEHCSVKYSSFNEIV